MSDYIQLCVVSLIKSCVLQLAGDTLSLNGWFTSVHSNSCFQPLVYSSPVVLQCSLGRLASFPWPPGEGGSQHLGAGEQSLHPFTLCVSTIITRDVHAPQVGGSHVAKPCSNYDPIRWKPNQVYEA